jgi:hypothetical protein
MSRRRFLGHSAAAVMIGAAPAALLRRSMPTTPPPLTRSRFMPALGTTFTVTDGAGAIEVVLAGIDDLFPVLRAKDEDRFALMFEAPRAQPLPEGIRTFRHPDLGDVDLFVSPVDRSRARRLQAVVNRPRSNMTPQGEDRG